MSAETDKKNVEPILDKLQPEAGEFPYPPSCDFTLITQETMHDAILAEINHNPQFSKQYSEWNIEDQTTSPLTEEELQQLNIEAEIELIELSVGDNAIVKDKIFEYMMKLDSNGRQYAIRYIKRKTSKFVQSLQREILQFIHTQIEYFVSGLGLKIELPDKLRMDLQLLTTRDLNKEKIARPMSKNGENSLISFTVIPPPNEFPDIDPYKKEALEILEEMKDTVYDSMERTCSFEFYFSLTSDLNFANLIKNESPEKLFWALCSLEKRKIDQLNTKLNNLQAKLHELLIHLRENGHTYDPEMLIRYVQSVENHIKQMWEQAIFPHLLFYGNLIFGEMSINSSSWF